MTMPPLTALQVWATAMRAAGQSPATIRRRTGTLRRFRVDHNGDRPERVRPEAIEAWLAPLHPATRAAYWEDLHAYYQWALRTGRIGRSPMAQMRRPRAPKGDPRPIETAELELALTDATGDVRAWILLGAYQGLRISETIAVRGEHVRGGGLRVLGKGGTDKTIPLHPKIKTLAASYPAKGWWFPGRGRSGHVSAAWASGSVVGHFDAHDVPMTYHQLRHWHCTALLEAGADLREAQTLMRHDSIASTVRYARANRARLAAALDRLPDGLVGREAS